MKALLIYGLKFGSDNPALTALGEKIKALGVDISFAHWDDAHFDAQEFDILIGHSFGGKRVIEITEKSLKLIKYTALIDPVDPAWFPLGIWAYWKKFEIPSRIAFADCFTRSWNILPPSGSILNADGVRYRNYPNINASHADIPDNALVSETILNRIRSLT